MAQILNSARARIGPLLQRAQSTVEPTYRLAEKHAVSQYDSLMKQNAEYVVKDPEAANKLLKQYVFTTLSRIPSGISHAQQEYQQASKTLAQGTHIDMKEAGVYALFAAEVYAWFCVGEIVGRGFTFGGYNI